MRFRVLCVLALTVAFAALGCGDDNPQAPGGGAPAPDLSGTYTMVSFTQGGVTVTPPVVMGTFMLTQTASSGTSASGTVSVDITVPDGSGGFNNIVDTGTYTIDSDGSWMQTGNITSASGTFSLSGGTLTVEATQPAIAANTTVWQKQ